MKRLAVILAAIVLSTSSCVLKDRQVELTLGVYTSGDWGVPNPDSMVLFDRAIERFEALHPGITVTYRSGMLREDYSEWIAGQALSDTLPDVFVILPEDFGKFVSLGMLQDLSGNISRDPDFDAGAYYSTALKSGQIGGTQYALPFEIAPTMMFVNKTLLLNEGIEIPGADWTWEEFYEISEKVTQDKNNDGKLDQFGCYDFTWESAAVTNGAEVLDGRTALFNSEKFSAAVDFAKRINGLNQGVNLTSVDFDKGAVAFCPLAFSNYRAYKSYPYRIKKYSDFEWDCIPMPTSRDGGYTSELQTLQMGISARSRNEKAAWDLLEYFTGDYEMQMSLLEYSHGLPAIRKVLESDEASRILQKDMPNEESYIDLNLLGEVIENAKIMPPFQQYSELKDLADSNLYPAIYGNANIDSAIKKLQREAAALLAN